jgi:hypothetical protein
MARACVEDTCSINAGNGIGNPNALALNAILDPNGGITCNGVIQPGTPGVGLGVNIPISTDPADTCDNILHKNGAGAFYVPQPGIDTYQLASSGAQTISIVTTAPQVVPVSLASLSVTNMFPNCPALAICVAHIRFEYNVNASPAPYWVQSTSGITATGGTPWGRTGATLAHRVDDYHYNARGIGSDADAAMEYEIIIAQKLGVGQAVTFDVFQNTLRQAIVGQAFNASLHIRTNPAPNAQASGFVYVMKDGVVS